MQKFLPEDSATSESAGPSISDDMDDKESDDKDSKKKKNRCAVCRKKVGLTGKLWANVYRMQTFYFEYFKLITYFAGHCNSVSIDIT